MKLELDEKELRRIRVQSMDVACDAFFTWLSAHSDAQSLLEYDEWVHHQTEFLEGLKQVSWQNRAKILAKIEGR